MADTAHPVDAAEQSGALSSAMTLLLALVSGAAVANVYYAQSLLTDIGAELRISAGLLGWVTAATQCGYLVGLVLVVPLGDRLDRRRMILVQLAISALALLGAAAAPTAWLFLALSAVFGASSTVVQVITAFAAATSAPGHRGRAVGTVTSGVVIGILLARTISGCIADLRGWRSVFAAAASVMLLLAGWLGWSLPRDGVVKDPLPYGRAVASVVTLTIQDRTFRVRSLIGMLMFASFGAVWGSMALPLATDPWHLTTTQIGLFGIVGAAGAFGAVRAGRWADRGHAELATLVALLLLAASWLAIGQTTWSLLLLGIGLLALDFAGQALHVVNQHLIIESDPAATTRLIGGYMVYYSIGTGGGAVAATTAYAHGGWPLTSALGAALAVSALAVWALDRFTHPRDPTMAAAPDASASCAATLRHC